MVMRSSKGLTPTTGAGEGGGCCDRFSRPHPPRTNVNRRDSCLSPLVTLTQKIPDRTCAPVASRPSQRRLTAPGPPTPRASSRTRRPEGSRISSLHSRCASGVNENATSPRAGFGDSARRNSLPSGGPGTDSWPELKYHGLVVSSARKNLSRLSATSSRPLVEGWVPSVWKSSQCHLRLSLRPTSPSAQRYGPHDSQGASTGPAFGS